MMPELDGFELARVIKSDASIAATRLVMLTSYGERGGTTAAQQLGIASYLAKPIRQAALFECLANVARTPHTTKTVIAMTAHAIEGDRARCIAAVWMTTFQSQ